MSTSNKHIKTKANKAGLRPAQKLVNQAEAHLRNTGSQVITSKKGEVGTSSSGSKVNIGILRGQQPTNATAQKAGTIKSTSEINISDIRKETGLSGAGVKWYLRYPKEFLKPEEALKKAQDRPKSSLPEPRKRGAAEISSHEGNAPKKSKPEPMGGRNPGSPPLAMLVRSKAFDWPYCQTLFPRKYSGPGLILVDYATD